MKKKSQIILVSILFMVFAFTGNAQMRMILNNNAFVVIDNNAKVVIQNPATNALATTGTGGNIVSENQLDQLIWNIGNSIGNYQVPWTTKPVVQGGTGVKIPMDMNISSAGDIGGRFVLSTYETATDNNTVFPTFPTAVTTMNGGSPSVDQSLNVVDRFWILDNTSYTSIPSATLSFAYDDNVNEIAVSNTLTEANLQAQRWNIALGSWESLLFGTTNSATNVTSGIVATPADFWPVWILVDLVTPLPVNFISQDLSNIDCTNELTWHVSNELNCDYYSISRSSDGINWEDIATIDGTGTSSGIVNYTYRDQMFNTNGILYYRITQVDYDGQQTPFDIQAVNAFCMENEEPIIYPNPVQSQLIVKSPNNGTLTIWDIAGKKVYAVHIDNGISEVNMSAFSSGVYTVQIVIDSEKFQEKVIKID